MQIVRTNGHFFFFQVTCRNSGCQYWNAL